MRIAICDDEVTEHEIMHELFDNYSQELTELEIVDYYQGKEMLEEKEFDIIFMDIELPEDNGVDVAAKIKEKFPLTKIIFVSNYPKYVTQSYYIDAFQFLIKPLTQEIFNTELNRCVEQIKQGREIIIRKAKEGNIALKKADIVYIEAQKRILTVYLQDGSKYQYYGRLIGEEKELGQDRFVRCHKSFIINLDYVRSFDYKNILTTAKKMNLSVEHSDINEKIKIPIGGAYHNHFKEKILRFWAN